MFRPQWDILPHYGCSIPFEIFENFQNSVCHYAWIELCPSEWLVHSFVWNFGGGTQLWKERKNALRFVWLSPYQINLPDTVVTRFGHLRLLQSVVVRLQYFDMELFQMQFSLLKAIGFLRILSFLLYSNTGSTRDDPHWINKRWSLLGL
jgi:hypothetical protein